MYFVLVKSPTGRNFLYRASPCRNKHVLAANIWARFEGLRRRLWAGADGEREQLVGDQRCQGPRILLVRKKRRVAGWVEMR